MKRFISIFASMVLVMVAVGAAMAESTDATASATSAPTASTGDNSHLVGQITAVSDSSITITTFGGGPGGDGNQPQPGSDQTDGQQGGQQGDQKGGPQGDQQGDQQGNQQGGTPPQGDQQQGSTPPQGDGQQSGTAPSATGESVTITVTSSTTITSRDSGSTLTLADLTVGEVVSVSVDGDATNGYTALTIEAGQAQQPQATDAVTTTAQ